MKEEMKRIISILEGRTKIKLEIRSTPIFDGYILNPLVYTKETEEYVEKGIKELKKHGINAEKCEIGVFEHGIRYGILIKEDERDEEKNETVMSEKAKEILESLNKILTAVESSSILDKLNFNMLDIELNAKGKVSLILPKINVEYSFNRIVFLFFKDKLDILFTKENSSRFIQFTYEKGMSSIWVQYHHGRKDEDVLYGRKIEMIEGCIFTALHSLYKYLEERVREISKYALLFGAKYKAMRLI